MRSSFLFLSVLAVCGITSTHSANAAERRSTIPAQFHGEWNMLKKDCGTARNDSSLRIAGKQVNGFESHGKVLAVVTSGKRELALILESRGEGETWLDTRRYRLSADGRELADISSQPELVRYRCR